MFFCCCCFFLSLSLHLSFSPPLLLFDRTISFTQFVHVDTADKPYLTEPATRVDGVQPSKETSCHAFVLTIFQVRHLSFVETRSEQKTSIVTRISVKLDWIRTTEWLKRSKKLRTCQYYVLCLSIFH